MGSAVRHEPLDVSRGEENAVKRKQTRRGTGGKSTYGGDCSVKFSILGNNSNGLKAKVKSLNAAVEFFKKPSCITIQETKLRQPNLIQLNGYEIFEKVRVGQGGGLLTAVTHDLAPVLISDGGESEILVVQANFGHQELRIINAYGPQEDEVQNSLSFWQQLEAEVIMAKDENQFTLIQLDANAKVGPQVIKSDPNIQSNNGKLLLEMLTRQNLFLLNASDLCQGKITRHRITKKGEEKSIIDYIIVCETLFSLLIEMQIDEDRIHTLTKYVSTRGRIMKIESDHNLIYCEFNLAYKKKTKSQRQTVFNFKNAESLEMYHEVTSASDKLLNLSNLKIPVEKKSKLFFQELDEIFHQTFKKSRIRNIGRNQSVGLMKVKSILKVHLRNVQNEDMKLFIGKKIQSIEEIISLDCSQENIKKVNEYIRSITNENGGFSQQGMWKLKSKLCPRPTEPPTAKLNKEGKLETDPQKLLKLYQDTYSERLSHKKMRPEYNNIFQLKNQLWKLRLEQCLESKTMKWTLKDLRTVLKSLKNNKCRDPLGMVNEIFKPGVIGEKMELAILSLMNSVKEEVLMPYPLALANISSIYKRRGSKNCLENDRGIFSLGVLRQICDKLLYVDLYPELEENMSNSNIGAMRKKNIRNHLFVVYGIVNSVLQGESPSVDIQIFDLKKCFDVLWLEDVMNDLFDSLPSSGQNDKLALLYESSRENYVSVKTTVGLTPRVNMPRIVMQGGSWGPMQCSNSIDKLGKDCETSREHLYSYKNLVNVPILSMVDDTLAFSTCGQDSLSLNTYINTHMELKKLEFHTPDSEGKTKCHKLHVGRQNSLCPDLKVHNTLMKPVLEDTYLGDVVRADGKNSSNIQARVSKGLGIVSQIMTILETVSFGEKFYNIALSLREAMFLNGILTNADVWYNVTKSDIEELEIVDRLLLRRILAVPESTCIEALYLETGCLDIATVMKAKRVNYLHYLLKENEETMLYKFFKAQWTWPVRGDWTIQVKEDLEDFNIPSALDYLEGISSNSFKTLIKKRSKEYALEKFLKLKRKHSKLDNLYYSEMKLQEYLELKDFKTEDAKVLLLWRLRMAKFGANFGDSSKQCPLCGAHNDSQEEFFNNCAIVQQEIPNNCKYQNVFINPNYETVQVLKQMMKIRENS